MSLLTLALEILAANEAAVGIVGGQRYRTLFFHIEIKPVPLNLPQEWALLLIFDLKTLDVDK